MSVVVIVVVYCWLILKCNFLLLCYCWGHQRANNERKVKIYFIRAFVGWWETSIFILKTFQRSLIER